MDEFNKENYPDCGIRLSFLEGLLPEMDKLFDYRTWFDEFGYAEIKHAAGYYENNDGRNYWWRPFNWVEPRIAMLDFLLNNR